MCQILLLCCLLLMWPRRPEPRGSAAPPPRSPSARTLEPWRQRVDEPVSERRTRTRKMRRRRRREGSSWRQLTPAVPLSRQLSIPVTWSAAVSLPRCTYAPLDVYGGKLRQVREKMSTKMRRRIQIFSTLQFRKPLAMQWKSAITNRRRRFRS